jgi:heptaprenyl diphosphate synthase
MSVPEDPLHSTVAVEFPALSDDLLRVDRALDESVGTSDKFLADVAAQVIGVGGERLRPTFTLCVAYAVTSSADEPATDSAVIGGVACELVHLGSLYHDDVIDEDGHQRGVPSVNARWSNIVAILAGDFLLARASSLAASLGADVAALLAETISELCRGQLLEVQHRFDVDRSKQDYESAIAGKTGALFATSCRIGGLVSGASGSTLDALTRFGHHVGMCLQIVDDVLDLSSADGAPGKNGGQDLLNGIYTLPAIDTLRRSAELRALLGGPLDTESLAEAGRLAATNGSIELALRVARDHAVKAGQAFDDADTLAPDMCASLVRVVDDLVTRQSSETGDRLARSAGAAASLVEM